MGKVSLMFNPECNYKHAMILGDTLWQFRCLMCVLHKLREFIPYLIDNDIQQEELCGFVFKHFKVSL